MIPKVIHYCWFGRNPKPDIAIRCLTSWKKQCPDYEIIEWNEDNYDLSKTPKYVQQAYVEKKWAFVTDYVRLSIVYDRGGIYLDTDVELIKNLDELLRYHAYFGFEGDEYINTGLGFGAEKKSSILKELMNDYNEIDFINSDGTYNAIPCPQRNTHVFLEHGMIPNGENQLLSGNIKILSSEYLCPIDNATRIIRKTKRTISIHHFRASWQSDEQIAAHEKLAKQRRKKLLIDKICYSPRWFARKIIGDARYERLKKKIKKDV